LASGNEKWAPLDFVDGKKEASTRRECRWKKGDGSGRRLIEAVARSVRRSHNLVIEPDGVQCTIALPLSGAQTEEIQMVNSAAS